MKSVVGFFLILCIPVCSVYAQGFSYPGSGFYENPGVACPPGTIPETLSDGYSWQQTGNCLVAAYPEYYHRDNIRPYGPGPAPRFSPPGFTGPAPGARVTEPPGFTGGSR